MNVYKAATANMSPKRTLQNNRINNNNNNINKLNHSTSVCLVRTALATREQLIDHKITPCALQELHWLPVTQLIDHKITPCAYSSCGGTLLGYS